MTTPSPFSWSAHESAAAWYPRTTPRPGVPTCSSPPGGTPVGADLRSVDEAVIRLLSACSALIARRVVRVAESDDR